VRTNTLIGFYLDSMEEATRVLQILAQEWRANPIDPESSDLCLVAKTNDITEVRRLLEKGISPNCMFHLCGPTPVWCAATAGNLEMLKLLHAHGADMNYPGIRERPIHAATFGNHFKLLKWLLDNGADVNAQNTDGNTALHICAMYGMSKPLKLLLDRGANLELTEKNGWTPLMHILSTIEDDMYYRTHGSNEKYIQTLELLLNAGANVPANMDFLEDPEKVEENEQIKELLGRYQMPGPKRAEKPPKKKEKNQETVRAEK
jgi:ankyrin repeat protein